MNTIVTLVALLLCAQTVEAQCNKEIRKPQKPHRVARIDWKASGRTWQAALTWETRSVSDDAQEDAIAVIAVRDSLARPTIGDTQIYYLTPNRCDLQIDPQLSAVKLMGRDFLLVTVPDGGDHGNAVVARMYTIDEKGHLTQVFYSVQRGHTLRGPECRHLLRSSVRADGTDGTRIAWVYEYLSIEWVKKKSECAAAKIEQKAYLYEWINGCFAIADRSVGRGRRLITDWDDEQCVTGKGLVPKVAPKK